MMNVLVCERPDRLALSRVPIPTRADDEVLIRVRRAVVGTSYAAGTRGTPITAHVTYNFSL